ncbi:MAG: hypothetical protein AAFR68_23100 [Pseudomonadota bacterium]
MAIGLLKLSSGHFSLEFEEEDVSDVVEVITSEFGKVEQKQYVMATEMKFGGATFVSQDEWQDPCLISSSFRGDQCLHQIYEKLSM